MFWFFCLFLYFSHCYFHHSNVVFHFFILSFFINSVWNFSWLILRSINAWDIRVWILFNLLLASIAILLILYCFLLCLWFVSVAKERLKCALAIPTQTPITLAKEVIDTPNVVDKTIKVLSIKSKAAIYLLSFLLIAFCSWLSELK